MKCMKTCCGNKQLPFTTGKKYYNDIHKNINCTKNYIIVMQIYN